MDFSSDLINWGLMSWWHVCWSASFPVSVKRPTSPTDGSICNISSQNRERPGANVRLFHRMRSLVRAEGGGHSCGFGLLFPEAFLVQTYRLPLWLSLSLCIYLYLTYHAYHEYRSINEQDAPNLSHPSFSGVRSLLDRTARGLLHPGAAAGKSAFQILGAG